MNQDTAPPPPSPAEPPRAGLVGVRRTVALAARGFMPDAEGDALWRAADLAARTVPAAPLLEIGTYCGKSAVWLGDAAERHSTILYTVDHHHGSEENQPGWEWHEPDLVDPTSGRIDTLPVLRATLAAAELEGAVVAVVGESAAVATHWTTPLALVFIDGGHGRAPAHRDYELWSPKVAPGGLLCIHDVFPDPADGGRPPFEIYCRALESEVFSELDAVGSLRVLQRAG